MSGKLFIISGPSGVGKTTLMHHVLSELQETHSLHRVITYTTKQPREGEVDGRDYHFVTRERFDELLSQNFFMEYSTAYTDCYGSPSSVKQGLSQGKSYMMIIDRVGAEKIASLIDDAVLIWIEAPNMRALHERLTQRGTESPEKIAQRLTRAQQEIDLELSHPIYTHYVKNDHFLNAAFQLKGIITQEIGGKAPFFEQTSKSASI